MADAMMDLLQRCLNRIEELRSCEADEREVESLAQDLRAALAQQPAQGEAVAWYDGNTFYANTESASMCCADMSKLRPVYYAPPAPSVSVPVAPPAAFAEWLRGNMPPDTIISDPDWWAMAIWSAARRAINAAPVASGGKASVPDGGV